MPGCWRYGAEKKTTSCSPCGHRYRGRYDAHTCRARDLSAGGVRIYVQFERWRGHGPKRRGVYVERLDSLAKNPRFTQRFAMHVGALCREMTNATVAQAERLHNSTVKALVRLCMQQQVARAGLPGRGRSGWTISPSGRGTTPASSSTISIAGGPSGSGGKGRTEANRDFFFATLGTQKTARIQFAAMDRWTPFRTSLTRHAPQAHVIFDKFHIVRHLGEALDAICRSEDRRLADRDSAIRCSPTARISLSTSAGPSPSCSRPTSDSTPPTYPKSPWASSETTSPRAGPAPSSRGGHSASRGSGSRPMRSSRQ